MSSILRFDLKRCVISSAIGIAYAIAIYLGNKLQYERDVHVLLLILIAVIGTGIIYLGFSGLDTVTEKNIFTREQSIRWFAITVLLLLLMWLPSFIAAFPGVFSYDAPYQLWQFASPNGVIKNGQPIVSSLFLYCVMKTGYVLFGRTWEAGLTFYLIIQMGLFASTFSYILIRYILKKSYVLYIVILLFFGLYPTNQLLLVNAAKDVMYGLFFLWFIMIFTDILKAIYVDKKVYPAQYVFFAITILLLMFWRHNTLYAFALTIPFMFLLIKRHKKIFIAILLSILTIVIYLFVTKFVYSLMGFKPGRIVESLAVPEQQLAYTYIKAKDTLKEDQIKFIEELMPEGFDSNYVSTNSDFIRPYLSVDYLNSIGLKKFVIQWAQIGLNHKKLYIVAFLNNTRGYWYPYYEFSRIGSDRYLEYENSTYDLKISTQRYMLGTKLSDFYYHLSDLYSIGEYKWISWFTSIAFTFWMTVIVTGYAIYKNRKELLLVYIYIWLLWLTLFAGPLALMRYVYPFTITLPFLFFEKVDLCSSFSSSEDVV